MAAVVAASLLAAAGPAGADAPDFLLQIPETQTSPGSGAGELLHPRGLAADPGNGYVYIADRRNARVSVYTAWGLFVGSWGWGVADGTAELQTCGPPEPEEDPDPLLCQQGVPGEGRGQMQLLLGGMAVDGEGNVWVGDLENRRVQKFTPEGEFLLMLGGDVNRTKTEEGAPAAQRNVCLATSTDVCQAGVSGEGPSQLSAVLFDALAYSPVADAILVGDKDGIQVFDLDGAHRETIPFTGALAGLAGETVHALDVDGDGNIYISLSGVEDVYKLSPAGAPLAPGKPGESQFDVGDPLGVAVDGEGNVYAVDDPPGVGSAVEARIVKFDPFGTKLIPTKAEEEAKSLFPYISTPGPALTGLATGFCQGSEGPGNLYLSFFTEIFPPPRSYVNAYGTPPIGCDDPPVRPPEVLSQFAVSVEREEATVKAQVNPLFWPDATYYVEYGTGKCSEGGCGAKAPLLPLSLTERSVNAPVSTVGVVLEGLTPGAVYHYRFVAQSGGGGPVFGIDPDGREGPGSASPEEGLEASFRTFRSPSPDPTCPNDAVRLGLSAQLPDCRAYEMVSPLDKGGGDAALWRGRSGKNPETYEVHKSSVLGDRFTYTSFLAFDDPESAAFAPQHLAERLDGGWLSEPISPPRTESPVPADFNFDDEFQGFTEDLCRGWVRPYSVAPLVEGAVEGYPNIYRRDNCAEPASYEAVTVVEPANRSPIQSSDLTTKGFSDDGERTVFATGGQLHPDAPDVKPGELLLYERTLEGLRFVCYLPNGQPSPQACSAGTLVEAGVTDYSSLHNAVSADGSRIFWTAYSGDTGSQVSRPGAIYVRVDGTETRNVSTAKAIDPAFFWTASSDGSKAIFSFVSGPLEDELYELDVDTETPVLIAKGIEAPLGASDDASRIYFSSTEDLDGTGPGIEGDHNAYLYEADSGGGSFTFVTRLAAEDVGAVPNVTGLSRTATLVPGKRLARVTPDGLHAIFMSVASPTPTGYDNREAHSGQPVAQVYLYDAVEEELRCLSCNPSGARPTGTEGVAARMQAWELRLHAPRVVSDDGSRAFFESFEALAPRDTNGAWDVYQWEEEGKGTCGVGSETFVPESGGCVDLISSGLSPAKSTFLDADPSGDNVFFSTQSSLVGPDYGLNDVYVARVGGGFPEPLEEEECEGAACQSPPPPPPRITPSTRLSAGEGNVRAGERVRRRCPKGKRRVKRAGKVRCVRRKPKVRAGRGGRR